ncbi:MAG: hypothetical protein ACI86H_002321 [bacterium]|jgi:hypothetical protein
MMVDYSFETDNLLDEIKYELGLSKYESIINFILAYFGSSILLAKGLELEDDEDSARILNKTGAVQDFNMDDILTGDDLLGIRKELENIFSGFSFGNKEGGSPAFSKKGLMKKLMSATKYLKNDDK